MAYFGTLSTLGGMVATVMRTVAEANKSAEMSN